MDKLKMHTSNQADENYKKLAALFPNAVTETITGYDLEGKPIIERAIDKDVLMQEISAHVVEGREERYQFTWPDKKKAVLAANAPIAATLRPVREESVGKDGTPGGWDSQNLYIEGDNLDVLKLLQETYLGKVKMIYIDPPYNTGNDFVYEDDFAEDIDGYLARSGQFDDQGNRLEQNTESNGRFHTDWLNMMSIRLRLAKTLLRDDGIIIISIDDNELYNLKKICDEIFGSINYSGTFVINSSPSAIDYGNIAYMHEYALMYTKDKSQSTVYQLPEPDKEFKYSDKKGGFNIYPLYNGNVAFNPETRPNLFYPFYLNSENEIEPGFYEISVERKTGWIEVYPVISRKDGIQRVWRWGKEKARAGVNDEIIGYKNEAGEWRIVQKSRLTTKSIRSLLLENEFSSRRGTSEVEQLLGRKVFSFPKPVELVKKFCAISTIETDIILDFFSGSATTAHAVMKLNAEDGGRRSFIMVQLPEKTDDKSEAYKADYKNICEIGKERIRRAGRKIKEEAGITALNLDIGFRVLKLDSSNMEDVYYNPEELSRDLLGRTVDNIKIDRTPEDLLFQVMLDLGVDLSSDIEEKSVEGKKVFIVKPHGIDKEYLVACFDKGITSETVTAIAKMQPYYAVFRDGSMVSDSVITNFDQIFRTYSPQTERKVL